MSRWADLCCGSGALTLELLSHGRVQPPAAYLGGKRAYAADIIRLMGGYDRPAYTMLTFDLQGGLRAIEAHIAADRDALRELLGATAAAPRRTRAGEHR